MPRLAVIAAHGGRWLAPWACVMVLSATAAYALDQALVSSSSWAQPAATEVQRTSVTEPTPAVFVLSLATIDGAAAPITINCLSRRDLVATDVLAVSLEELPVAARQVCMPPVEGGPH
jgi:hypothetical protein